MPPNVDYIEAVNNDTKQTLIDHKLLRSKIMMLQIRKYLTIESKHKF